MERESGVSRCKLLHTEWMNKALLDGTGEYTRYSVIRHNGKEHFLKSMYI